MGDVNESAIDQLASTPEDDLPPKSDVVGALLRDFRSTILRLRAAEERVRELAGIVRDYETLHDPLLAVADAARAWWNAETCAQGGGGYCCLRDDLSTVPDEEVRCAECRAYKALGAALDAAKGGGE